MPYYVRVLGKTNPKIAVDQLKDALTKESINASINIDEGTANDWTQLIVQDEQNRDFVLIEKNIVAPGQLGAEELVEFREEIEDCRPKSSVKWLTKFFEKVKVIYAFQILDAIYQGDNWTTLDAIKTKIWIETNGILQADNEGFSNEDGYHILWQFSDTVTGNWNMAVRNFLGGWTNFKMDLGNPVQRQEFWEGKVPKGAIKI